MLFQCRIYLHQAVLMHPDREMSRLDSLYIAYCHYISPESQCTCSYVISFRYKIWVADKYSQTWTDLVISEYFVHNGDETDTSGFPDECSTTEHSSGKLFFEPSICSASDRPWIRLRLLTRFSQVIKNTILLDIKIKKSSPIYLL